MVQQVLNTVLNGVWPEKNDMIFKRGLIGIVWFCIGLSIFLSNAAYADPPSKLNESALEKVTLQLKWHHQFQFAGYYAAQKEGYYQAEGLDVDIQPRDLHENNIQQVIDNKAQYGVSDSILLLYQAKNAPVVIVAPIFQHSPQVLFTLASSGLGSPYKLKNKKIALYQQDTDGFSVLAMLHEAGVSPTIERTIKSDMGMLVQNQVDAYSGYLTNEAYAFQENNIPINVINPINYGVDLYGDMLFTNQKELANHPERVEKMRKATLKGWRYAMNHKAEMARYIQSHYNVKKSFRHLMYEANAIEDAMSLSTTPIGKLDEGRLQFIANLFQKHGLIDSKVNLKKGIYRSNERAIEFTPPEKKWLNEHPVVHLAIDRFYAPVEFVDENGRYSGIAKDIFQVIQQKTGIQFKPAMHLSWPEATEFMKQKKLDVFSAVIETEERKEYVNFTKPYFKLPMAIATRESTPYIADSKQLSGKVICVVRGYASHAKLKRFYPNLSLLLVDTPKEGIEAVANGKAYGYVDNVAVIGHHIKNSGLANVKISGEMPFRADIAIAVRDDWPELYSIIQKVLQQVSSETYTDISNKWLQVSYQKQYNWQQMTIVLTPFFLLLLVFAFFNRKLRNTQKKLKETNKQLSVLSVTDHLTGVYNRQYLDQCLDGEVERANRYDSTFSIIMMDLDYFKKVNDQYGHLVGDEVLVVSTQTIETIIRKTDIFGRWGGEEIILICPETSLAQATRLAKKVQKTIEHQTFPENISQTFSLGVAEYQKGEAINDCLNRADQNLYKAKQLGRNQVCPALELD
ncbi:diguanylate cyclase [Hydrogenovibrio sp. 3SP14C1]|uniref:transporter substrate-binding domain-containing diguanylate cyclase n=1 Tax=Hydrogenovibrio sp. 3SP14C1 TaxID=3038774 RepID=UPI002416E958|nr:diguanylate cyclase [Hydrogenovibrio sp. 3SP14C1]MDG4812567.1 diguanylate cyclase [Hydrogenovibrio sp. 3SP14C1]